MKDHTRTPRHEELLQYVTSKGLPPQFIRLAKTKDLEITILDMQFLIDRTNHAKGQRLSAIMQEYVARWREGMAAEQRPLRKQGAGRFAANGWLRLHRPSDEEER